METDGLPVIEETQSGQDPRRIGVEQRNAQVRPDRHRKITEKRGGHRKFREELQLKEKSRVVERTMHLRRRNRKGSGAARARSRSGLG